MAYRPTESKSAEEVYRYAAQRHKQVQEQYARLCDDMLFWYATMDLSENRKRILIEDALSLLGSPYCRVSRVQYNEEGYDFLAQFTKEG